MFATRTFHLARGVASACQNAIRGASSVAPTRVAPSTNLNVRQGLPSLCFRQIRNEPVLPHNLFQRATSRAFSTSKSVAAAAAETPAVSSGLIASMMAFPKAQPFMFNILIATGKTSVADLVTQMAVEKKELNEVDWVRNGVFVVFGMVYLGGFQYWLQVNMFGKMFPTMHRFANQPFAAKLKDTAGMIDCVKQIFFDVFIHLPLMYFPTFYSVKEFVQGDSWNPVDWVVNGCTKYYNNAEKDLTAMFCLWFPADIFIFSVPIWLRLPTRHVVSLGWTMYLSFLRGGSEPVAPCKELELTTVDAELTGR